LRHAKNEDAECVALGWRGLERRAAMNIVIVGLAFMFAIWIAVIWGSNLFTKNMQ
jgi:formate/nitrite transporter FocA (FNT family)